MNSRQKGAAGERELSRILRERGYNTSRGQQYSGANGDADVVGLPGIHIECKRVERLNISDAMVQSIGDARPGEMPTVFHRKNCDPWKTTMLTSDWLKLYGNQKEKWVMCSEKLPEECENVLVWYEYFRYGDYNRMFQTCGIGYYVEGHWRGDVNGVKARCIAWMPLPAPPEGCYE